MTKRFFVNPFLATVSAATALFSLTMFFSLIGLNRFVSAFVFLLIALLFLYLFSIYGAIIRIESDGIRRSFLGYVTRFLSWNSISEIGVTGTKVFNKDSPQKTGSLYIYLSEKALAEEERFKIALEWPPKEQVFLTYSEAHIAIIQAHWRSKIQAYNAGDIYFS